MPSYSTASVRGGSETHTGFAPPSMLTQEYRNLLQSHTEVNQQRPVASRSDFRVKAIAGGMRRDVEADILPYRSDLATTVHLLLETINSTNYLSSTESVGSYTSDVDLQPFLSLSSESFWRTPPHHARERLLDNSFFSAPRKELRSIARIRELASKPDGWKGAGSIAALKSAKLQAEELCARLLSVERYREPHVGLNAEGDFSLFWRVNNAVFEIVVYGDGTYSYCGLNPEGDVFCSGEAEIGDPLPEKNLTLIEA